MPFRGHHIRADSKFATSAADTATQTGSVPVRDVISVAFDLPRISGNVKQQGVTALKLSLTP